LFGIVLGALAFRIGYVLMFTRHETGKLYDAFWYGVTALELQHSEFFRSPFALTQTAAHPPLTSLLIGTLDIVARPLGSTVQSLAMPLLGALVVLVVGLLGRAVAGPWVGLTAALLAAFAPNFWIPSGILMSETPAMLFMALILLCIVRFERSPTFGRAALLGAACGAEALVRAELILFVPALLIPAVLAARRLTLRRRLGILAVGVLAVVVVIGPWVGRNLVTFQDPTYLSTGDGLALLGANCPVTYSGAFIGSWSLVCAVSVTGPGDESVESARDQHAALEYARHHAGRLPAVVAARVGRLWDVYQPFQMARGDVNEGRPVPASFAGLWVYYALLPLGVAGCVLFRRRGIRIWFLLVPAGVLTVVAMLFYGSVRFRAPFEVCLVVLAAPTLVVLCQRGWGAVRRQASSSGSQGGAQRAPSLPT
jgi:4-amino-4-deoxy-L-arabinose transferase-like glycosyltransferase